MNKELDERALWLYPYEGYYRYLAKGVKNGDLDCIGAAGNIFAQMLPRNSILVPMPNHRGFASNILTLCEYIKRLVPSMRIEDCLFSFEHKSSYEQKKNGDVPTPFEMYLKKRGMYLKDSVEGSLFIIDNVIGSGVTANAALDVLPNAQVLALTRAE